MLCFIAEILYHAPHRLSSAFQAIFSAFFKIGNYDKICGQKTPNFLGDGYYHEFFAQKLSVLDIYKSGRTCYNNKARSIGPRVHGGSPFMRSANLMTPTRVKGLFLRACFVFKRAKSAGAARSLLIFYIY
ncbi:MAG: hypothetical protein E7585_06780 [Ruminococcaceae bacterium]|nr:hypothetical protein [Oscillospiraceae bacterium]